MNPTRTTTAAMVVAAITLFVPACGSATATPATTTTTTAAAVADIDVRIDTASGTITGVAPIETHLIRLAKTGRFDPDGLTITETQPAEWHPALWKALFTHPVPTGADITITARVINLGGTVPDHCYTELANTLAETLPSIITINVTATEPPDPWTDLERLGDPTIHFDTGSAEIPPDDRANLEQFAPIVAQLPGTRIDITGHTDTRGDEHAALSQARADSVAAIFAAAGVPAAAITTAGKGDTQPAAQGGTDQALQLNRRAVITLAQIPPRPACSP